MFTVFIQRQGQDFDDCEALSSDPDSEEGLPTLHVIVNNRPTRNLVLGVAEKITEATGLRPRLYKSADKKWFGFRIKGTFDIEGLYWFLRERIPTDNGYEIHMLPWGDTASEETSLTTSQEVEYDVTV